MTAQRSSRMVCVLTAGLLLLGACGGNDEPQATDAPDEAGGGVQSTTLSVSAVDNSYEPASLTAAGGAEVTVEVTNDGSNPHTFTIDDLDVDTSTISSGDSASVSFTMPDESVTFYCTVHGEQTMSGTIEPS